MSEPEVQPSEEFDLVMEAREDQWAAIEDYATPGGATQVAWDRVLDTQRALEAAALAAALARAEQAEHMRDSALHAADRYEALYLEGVAERDRLRAALMSRHIAWLHTDGCAVVIDPGVPISDPDCDCGRDEAESAARALTESGSGAAVGGGE